MANQLIVDELQTPAAHGIDGIVRSYTNPGGVPKDSALAAIEANSALFKQKDISVYRKTIEGYEIFDAYTSTALSGLSTVERDDYAAFIVPMLSTSISNPDQLLKDLIDNVVFKGTSGDNPIVRANFDSLIRENTSVASILGVRASAGDLEQAMFQLGWIT